MKTLAKRIVLFALIMTVSVFSAFANGEGKGDDKKKKKKDSAYSYKAAINIHRDNIVAVHFMKPADQRVTVTIRNQVGHIIKFESIRKYNMVVKRYVLDQFPKGKYTVEVKSGDEVLTKEIELK